MKRLWLLLLICLFSMSVQAELVNRYSFEGDMTDSVGDDGDGVLVGDASVVNGTLNLEGAGWAELPITVIDGMTSVTLEAWYTYGPADREWTRVFDFGKTNDGATDGHSYIMYTPSADIGDRGQESRFSMARQFGGTRQEQYSWGGLSSAFPPVTPAINHLVCVYENGVLTHYLNGVLDGTNTTEIVLSDITVEHAKLGAGSFTNDPGLMGAISEFRIYDSAASVEQAVLNYQLGDAVYQDAAIEGMLPANKATNRSVNPLLSWAPDGVTATSYKVYIDKTYDALEPNGTPTVVEQVYVSATPSVQASGLDNVTEYFWRVDTTTASGVVMGPVFSFTTAPAEPTIVTQPVTMPFADGEEIMFTLTANNPLTGDDTGLSYQWSHNGSPVGADSNSLVIAAAPESAAGEYSCIVSIAGNASYFIESDTVLAVLKAMTGYWPLDGDAVDMGPGGYDGTEMGIDEGATGLEYVDAVVGKGVVFDGIDDFIDMGTEYAASTSGHLSCSFWVKKLANSDWSGFVGEFNQDNTQKNGFLILTMGTGGGTRFAVNRDDNSEMVADTPDLMRLEEWAHVVCTFDTHLMKAYVNGNLVSTSGDQNGTPYVPKADANFAIGHLYRTGERFTNAVMDDVKMYNYALTQEQVEDIYLASMDYICTEYSTYDFNRDCKVDFADLKDVVSGWLDCGRFPSTTCDE